MTHFDQTKWTNECVFLQARKQLAEKIDHLTELNKEYYYFQADEDVARITLFTNQVLHTVYRFIGEDKYISSMSKFYRHQDFFLKCDLEYIHSVLADYDEQEYENDDPNRLYSVLTSFLCRVYLLPN